MHTLAKKKDTTISQITSFVNAVNAAVKVRVLVAIATVADKNAQAPTGSGSRTNPAIVDTKMDNRAHPCRVIPAGVGTRKFNIKPNDTHVTRGKIFAPGQPVGADAGAAAATEAVEACGTTRAAGFGLVGFEIPNDSSFLNKLGTL